MWWQLTNSTSSSATLVSRLNAQLDAMAWELLKMSGQVSDETEVAYSSVPRSLIYALHPFDASKFFEWMFNAISSKLPESEDVVSSLEDQLKRFRTMTADFRSHLHDMASISASHTTKKEGQRSLSGLMHEIAPFARNHPAFSVDTYSSLLDIFKYLEQGRLIESTRANANHDDDYARLERCFNDMLEALEDLAVLS